MTGTLTRTFIAIELPSATRAHLAGEIARLGRALPGVRWADPAGLHLTLAFLGELDDARLAEAHSATREAALTVAPFALRIGGLGTFGPPGAPRVVWAGVTGDLRALARLHEALAAALERRGFARDARPFAPHLTLARLRTPPTPDHAARLASLVSASQRPTPASAAGAPIPVNSLSVMKSELVRPAARYTRLHAVPLGQPAAQP